MPEQIILDGKNGCQALERYIKECGTKKIFLVCGQSIRNLSYHTFFEDLEKRTGIKVVRFSDFSPNPSYESVVQGVKLFRDRQCDMIVAVGGGSAIDVAKCIKLYSNMQDDTIYLEQTIIPNDIEFLAIPTTAGTGSESTRFAVIYYQGEKQSVADESCIPRAMILDASVLNSLPDYHRKATMLDAFGHAIESFWSVNSTKESKAYSKEAIKLILENMDSYLKNDAPGNEKMLLASNFAGKAINITQTTAGHAMCYKLTTLYGVAHGHAVALCVAKLWGYMIEHMEQCTDSRGKTYLAEMFTELAEAMMVNGQKQAAEKFQNLLNALEMDVPNAKVEDIQILKRSVNLTRLKNNPVMLDAIALEELYREILKIS